jgi:hypothetical protein
MKKVGRVVLASGSAFVLCLGVLAAIAGTPSPRSSGGKALATAPTAAVAPAAPTVGDTGLPASGAGGVTCASGEVVSLPDSSSGATPVSNPCVGVVCNVKADCQACCQSDGWCNWRCLTVSHQCQCFNPGC